MCACDDEKQLDTAQAKELDVKQIEVELSEEDDLEKSDETTLASAKTKFSRRDLIRSISAGAVALGITTGTVSAVTQEAQAHDATRGCPDISRLSWNLGPVEDFDWQCLTCQCNDEINYISRLNFQAPIKLDSCDEEVVRENSLFVASLKIVWTAHDCGTQGSPDPKVIGRYGGPFQIFSPTTGSLIAAGDMVGTLGFVTDFPDPEEEAIRCCAFPHGEGYLTGTLIRTVIIQTSTGTFRVRERCVLHATLASTNQELSPEDFCKHGPLGLQVHINGTIECPCFRIQSTQASGARELAVSEWQATPNPVTSFSPIAFSVQGVGITGVQVAVYNLLGIKLFESDKASGSSFIWNGVDRNGLPLANGVYLYRITAQGRDGHTVPSQLKKLVIRR